MRPSPILLLLAAAGLSACAPRGRAASSPAPVDHAEQVRADSVRLPYTAADVKFMTDMIGHHAQAILISRWVPGHTDDAELRTLAARIINAQTDDIALMRRWLADRGKPLPSVTPDGVFTPAPADPNDEHAGHDMGDHAGMAGMLDGHELVRHEIHHRAVHRPQNPVGDVGRAGIVEELASAGLGVHEMLRFAKGGNIVSRLLAKQARLAMLRH